MDPKKIRCAADEHYYDPTQNASCPFCRATVVQGGRQGRQVSPQAVPPAAETAASDPAPATAPAQAKPAGGERKTVLQWARRPRPVEETAGDDNTPPADGPAASATPPEPAWEFDQAPVVGWLAVVAGPGIGRSLEVRPGMNWLGRDPDMDIPLAFGDAGVSAREHAVLLYDVECNGYFIKHERGRNLTYLNEKRITSETRLKAYDRIRIHDTELLFLPLCGKRFQWE
jgi:hypothetical protein